MIKFFRKIRQNLLSEGKTGKYFKYAIGEIILVVIGILIALQINNWNELRKAVDREHSLYLNILIDLENEDIILNSALDQYKQHSDAYYQIYYETISKINYDSTSNRYNILRWHNIFDFIISNKYKNAIPEITSNNIAKLINSMTEEEKNNTIVIFIGDNGTPNEVVQEYASNRAKGSLYQGGINVPMIVSGNGVSRFNASENALVNATDLYATIAEIAGLSINEINDSKSIKELLTDADGRKRDYIYSEIGKETGGSDYTIRNASHKYIKFNNGNEGLYNMSSTYIEGTNLLNTNQLPLSSSDEAVKNELILKLAEIQQ